MNVKIYSRADIDSNHHLIGVEFRTTFHSFKKPQAPRCLGRTLPRLPNPNDWPIRIICPIYKLSIPLPAAIIEAFR